MFRFLVGSEQSSRGVRRGTDRLSELRRKCSAAEKGRAAGCATASTKFRLPLPDEKSPDSFLRPRRYVYFRYSAEIWVLTSFPQTAWPSVNFWPTRQNKYHSMIMSFYIISERVYDISLLYMIDSFGGVLILH